MKKLLALLTALILALSCTLALAEDAQFSDCTITSKLTVDTEAALALMSTFGVGDDEIASAGSILKLLSNLGSKLSIVEDGCQLDLNLKDTTFLSLAAAFGDDGLTIGSNLFPSYLLTLSADTLTSLLEGLTSQLDDTSNQMDAFNALIDAASEHINTLVEALGGAISYGEVETGEFTYEDALTFNTRVPIEVDVKAAAEAINTFAENLQNDESFQAAVEAAKGAGLNLGDETFEPIPVDGEMPTVACNCYMNLDENGNQTDATTYVTVEVAGPGEDGGFVNVYVLSDETGVVIDVQMPDEVTLSLTVEPTDTGASISFNATVQEFFMGLHVVADTAENLTLTTDLYLMDDTKPVATEVTTIAQGGERTLSDE